MAHQTDKAVADIFFDQFITRYGIPEDIVTDLGGCFVSNLFKHLCNRLRIHHITTTAYRPQGNGANERMHSTLYGILRMLTKNHGKDWRILLPHALYVYRNMHHSAIGTTPFHLSLDTLEGWSPLSIIKILDWSTIISPAYKKCDRR